MQTSKRYYRLAHGLAVNLAFYLLVFGPASMASTNLVSGDEKIIIPAWQPDWNTNRPNLESYLQLQENQRTQLVNLARTTSADSTSTNQNHLPSEREFALLSAATQLGDLSTQIRLDELGQAKLNLANTPAGEKFSIQAAKLRQNFLQEQAGDFTAALPKLEQSIRDLQNEFPGQPEIHLLWLELANYSSNDHTLRLARQIMESAAPAYIKAAAVDLWYQANRLGKPLDLQFTASNGTPFNLAQFRGHVVLVHFWASWYGPSVTDLVRLRDLWDTFHERGLEIVGINLDLKQEAFTKCLADYRVDWPQFFDGNGWHNRLGQSLSVKKLPAIWLVETNGILSDLKARTHLRQKVANLIK